MTGTRAVSLCVAHHSMHHTPEGHVDAQAFFLVDESVCQFLDDARRSYIHSHISYASRLVPAFVWDRTIIFVVGFAFDLC
jgi:hypothetical protein